MNKGYFSNTEYVKEISFNKAVLWKDRQLSIPVWVVIGLTARKTKTLRFVDREKAEAWVFDSKKVLENGEFKEVGQEKQFYFSIDTAQKVKLKTLIAGQENHIVGSQPQMVEGNPILSRAES